MYHLWLNNRAKPVSSRTYLWKRPGFHATFSVTVFKARWYRETVPIESADEVRASRALYQCIYRWCVCLNCLLHYTYICYAALVRSLCVSLQCDIARQCCCRSAVFETRETCIEPFTVISWRAFSRGRIIVEVNSLERFGVIDEPRLIGILRSSVRAYSTISDSDFSISFRPRWTTPGQLFRFFRTISRALTNNK